MRDPGTGLLGNTLHTDDAEWLRKDSGIGAGIDSFYEYLLKVAYLAAHTASDTMQVLHACLHQHTCTNQHKSHRSPIHLPSIWQIWFWHSCRHNISKYLHVRVDTDFYGERYMHPAQSINACCAI